MSQTVERPSRAKPDETPRRPTGTVAGSRRPARQTSLLGDDLDELLVEARPVRRKPLFVLSPFMRIRLCALLLTVVSAAIILQLFSLQIQDRYNARERAAAMQNGTDRIEPKRGLIQDANGLLLASNTWVYNIYGAPEGLSEKQSADISQKLAAFLPQADPLKIKQALTYTDDKHIYNLIAAAVDSDTANRITNAKLLNVYLEPKPRRTYPNGSMLSDVLGFTNNENQGAYGIEGYYNQILHGTSGTRLAQRDADGNPIVLGEVKLTPAVDGANLTLTIDSGVQTIVERELKKGMDDYQPDSAVAIVADPNTGAILAYAAYPNYNPNDFYKTDPALFKDPLVSDVYEPGSTFKILTAAIGIDTGAITPDSNAGTLPGCVIEYGQKICNYNSVGYSNQTPIVTLTHSSNVGAMWIAKRIGMNKYYDYIQKFGFGEQTGIDLGGEVEGILKLPTNKNWGPLDFLENAFGQSIAVTPVQLVAAVSAVANGGKLMKPYVVSKVSYPDHVQEVKPTVVRQVISAQSSKTTTDMLVQAVKAPGSETRLADVPGYRIAAKTGTATLYNSPLTIGSTIAYAPADNPRFVVLVRYDKPKKSPWGSNTAAPTVQNITKQLFTYYGIPPTEPIK